MKFKDVYYALKILVPFIIILIGVLWILAVLADARKKDNLLRKHGFVFHEGLSGRGVAYEFRDRYKRGSTEINAEHAMNMKYKDLVIYIKKVELSKRLL